MTRRFDPILSVIIACVPLVWLAQFNTTFSYDWNNHLWMIAYTGEYFRRHFSFPQTFNTTEVAGIAMPIFYGSLFYPLVGMVSAATGAAIALRVVVVSLYWLQCTQIAKLVGTVYPGRFVAWTMAAIVSFAIYPLTNLYNRTAITEFVAVSLLTSASAIFLRVLYTSEDPAARRSTSLAWLLLALSAGTHPITAVLGGALFLLLVFSGLAGSASRRSIGAAIAVNAALFSITLSAWFYATLNFQRGLGITSGFHFVTSFPDSIDLWWARLAPIPFDIRPHRQATLDGIPTPYLDAQINVGLLMVAGFLVFQVVRRLRRGELSFTKELGAGATSLGLFALVCFSSVSAIWPHVPFLAFVQFAYRLVSYCDLLLLGGAVVLLRVLRPFQGEFRRSLTVCATAALALMAIGVPVKWAHAGAVQGKQEVRGVGFRGDRETLANMPASLYWTDYANLTGFAGPAPEVPMTRLPVKTAARFGNVESAVSTATDRWIETNIVAFPWNRIVLDGQEVPTSKTHVSGERFLSVEVQGEQQASRHVVSYAFSPDRTYVVLRWASTIALTGWAAGLLILGQPEIQRKIRWRIRGRATTSAPRRLPNR